MKILKAILRALLVAGVGFVFVFVFAFTLCNSPLLTTKPLNNDTVLVYKEKAGKPKDISWIPLGNGSGHITAVLNPMGLPIISQVRSLFSDPTIVGGEKRLTVDYAADDYSYKNWSPWFVCNIDAMQPVVSYVLNGKQNIIWPVQMNAVDRYYQKNSNVVTTINSDENFQLTSEDFITPETDMLVRVFTVKNISRKKLSFRLFYYAPLNAGGKQYFRWVPESLKFKDLNNVEYLPDEKCLFFNDDQNNIWLMGSDIKPSGFQCDILPGALKNINRGKLDNKIKTDNSVVDAALSFESGILSPKDSFSVTIYLRKMNGLSRNKAISEFSTKYVKESGYLLKEKTIKFWKDWLESGKIPKTSNPRLDDLIKRILVSLKACSWDIGGLPCDIAELPSMFFRDAPRPAYGFELFGFHKDATAIMRSLQAYSTKYGMRNSVPYEPEIKKIIDAGFNDQTVFKDVRYFSCDDPSVLIYFTGEIFRNSRDTTFLKEQWPFIKYLVGLSKRDIGPQGFLVQNAGFQDDMMQWAFKRGDKGEKGIVCSYTNMMFVGALETASELAAILDHKKESEEYSYLASSVRKAIEKYFWNEELKQYAYFYDPTAVEQYGPSGKFTGVKDVTGGQFVFPEDPIVHGLTMIQWFNYSKDMRAESSFQLAKKSIEPLTVKPERFGTYYMTYLYAKAKLKDLNGLDESFKWLIDNTPLPGVPEEMPTGNRAVQMWPNGEALIAIYEYLKLTENK
jgi:hypothetical protein